MKKLLLILAFLLLPVFAFAYTKYEGGKVITKEEGYTGSVLTADGTVKVGTGVLRSLVLTFDGAAAGDGIVLKEGGSSGTTIFEVEATAADQVIVLSGLNLKFDGDLYLDLTVSSGQLKASFIYS